MKIRKEKKEEKNPKRLHHGGKQMTIWWTKRTRMAKGGRDSVTLKPHFFSL